MNEQGKRDETSDLLFRSLIVILFYSPGLLRS